MSDDLVKRLRGWHDMPADAWFTTMETAADRIEKLETALREIINKDSFSMDWAIRTARKTLEGKDD